MNRVTLLYFMGMLGVALAIIVPGRAWVSPLTYMVILPLGVTWLWRLDGHSLWDLGYRFDKGWSSKVGLGIIIGIAIPLLFQIIEFLGGWIVLSARGGSAQAWISSMLLAALKMVLIVGIEELVFRGFFLQAIAQRKGILSAILASSLLWGAGHLTSMATNGLTLAAIVTGMLTFLFWGSALSISYLRAQKSLWLPYGLHLGINLGFSLLGSFFVVESHAPDWWLGHPAWRPESGILGMLIWSILAWIIYSLTGKKRIQETAASHLPAVL